jgi:hypothetical protein
MIEDKERCQHPVKAQDAGSPPKHGRFMLDSL